MTKDDILLDRAHDEAGAVRWASPMSHADSVEELWVVVGGGRPDATFHPFTMALDAALNRLAGTDGKVYVRKRPTDKPELYEPTA